MLGAGGAGGEDAAGMVRTLVTTLHDDVVRGAAAMHPTASASVRVEASSADLAVMKIATAGVWANGRPLSIIEPAPPAATLDERDTVSGDRTWKSDERPAISLLCCFSSSFSCFCLLSYLSSAPLKCSDSA